MRMRTFAAMLFGALLTIAAPLRAEPRDVRVPIVDGQVEARALTVAVYQGLGLDASSATTAAATVRIDLHSDRGRSVLAVLNAGLGDGCRAKVAANELVLTIDRTRLPTEAATLFRAFQLLGEAASRPGGRFGLHMPAKFDPAKPLVVLVHGVDSDAGMWAGMDGLLRDAGHQVAYLVYPDDGPVAGSSRFLAERLGALRALHPGLRVDLVAFSMGGLVARDYVEGPAYGGDVDRLVLCGTPNAGSSWARGRFLLEWNEHYRLRKENPDWDKSWAAADGNGEAGDDMLPGSPFLARLNALPRREGVRYTIVAGQQHPCRVKCAEWWDCTASWIPQRTRGLWGFRHAYEKCVANANEVRGTPGETDGVVSLESARLAGVSDVVVVHSDHTGLCCGAKPAAWETIKDRLSR